MQHHLRHRSVILVILSLMIPVSLAQLAQEAVYADAGSDQRFWPDPSASAGSLFSAAEVGPTLDGSRSGSGSNPARLPAEKAMVDDAQLAFNRVQVVAGVAVVSYTLALAEVDPSAADAAQDSTDNLAAIDLNYTTSQIFPSEVTTLTVQVFLPWLMVNPTPPCPTTSAATFEIIPLNGNRTDRPDDLHGDLNLSLRGYAAVDSAKTLQDYAGGADPNAPQLAGLFDPNQFPGISTVHRVNSWDWACGANGCPGPPIPNPDVTLMGLTTAPGQAIFIPERSPNIYGGSYKAMVLYAEEQRITLGYTRQDSVAPGYTVHLENLCVDPNLLSLYREQVGPDGLRIFKDGSYWLPALRLDQALGTALADEVRVSVRDRGTFMDPRSRKDWWLGY